MTLRGTGIRLAGATSDVHIMNVRTGKWDRATPAGEAPSPRAAHAAAAVGSMVVVQVSKYLRLSSRMRSIIKCKIWRDVQQDYEAPKQCLAQCSPDD